MLQPWGGELLAPPSSQIEFRLHGRRAYGYPADLLQKVCGVFLDAKAANALSPQQEHIAAKALILIRGLAHVGIVALVDEATGYQARKGLASHLGMGYYIMHCLLKRGTPRTEERT